MDKIPEYHFGHIRILMGKAVGFGVAGRTKMVRV
jgi:hypothetical protein